MVEVGVVQELEVVKLVDFGVYLDGDAFGEILLPKRYITTDLQPGDSVQVFVYFDSEERIIATTEKPLAQVGECAFLEVKQVNDIGAFVDIGISKQILVPFREQQTPMKEGETYCVRLYVDSKTGRITASSKIDSFLSTYFPPYKEGDEVDILVHSETDLGYKVIIEDDFLGLLYKNEVFTDIQPGDTCTAFIQKIREDGKIDLRLQKSGFSKTEETLFNMLKKLEEHKGFLPYTDKSSPEEISKVFGMSKKTFKMTIGMLFKQRKIIIEPQGIRSTKSIK